MTAEEIAEEVFPIRTGIVTANIRGKYVSEPWVFNLIRVAKEQGRRQGLEEAALAVAAYAGDCSMPGTCHAWGAIEVIRAKLEEKGKK
jgi:hypothetical protein